MIDDFVFAGHAAVAAGAERVSVSDCLVDLVPAQPGWDDWYDDFADAARRGDTVLTVGFPAEHVEPVLAELAAAGQVRGDGGLPDRLGRRLPLPGGRVLGFEPIGFDCGTWHSWGCLGGLVDDVRAATGVRPDASGLIQAEADAWTAARRLTASGLGDPKVFFWIPAVVLSGPAPRRGRRTRVRPRPPRVPGALVSRSRGPA